MPTYEYECKKCGYTFEVFQAMSDEPVKKCPQCGKGVRRLIQGGAGVIFKGSGFYVTDKASKGESKNGKKTAPSPVKEPSGAPSATTSAKAGADSGGSAASKETAADSPRDTKDTKARPAARPAAKGS